MRIEFIPLEEVKKWPTNPKLHDEDALGSSIRRFGFVSPLVVDESSGHLVAGHGRIDALSRMRDAGESPPGRIQVENGTWRVPVIRGVAFSSRHEAEAYLVADNRLAEIGGWDPELLTTMFASFGEDLTTLIGFSTKDVERMMGQIDRAISPAQESKPYVPTGTAENQEFEARDDDMDEETEDEQRPGHHTVYRICCPQCGHEWVA